MIFSKDQYTLILMLKRSLQVGVSQLIRLRVRVDKNQDRPRIPKENSITESYN